jgi:hypothetical protein
MNNKLAVISFTIVVAGLAALLSCFVRQCREKNRLGLLHFLLASALAVGGLVGLEIVDLFFIRRYIPVTAGHFWGFTILAFRYGTLAILVLGTVAWLGDGIAYRLGRGVKIRERSLTANLVSCEPVIALLPILIAFIFLIVLAASYLQRQWWLEDPLPFCLLPVVLSLGVWLLFLRGEKSALKRLFTQLTVWTFSLGYLVSTQIMERFHNTDLRFGVMVLLFISLIASLSLLVPSKRLPPGKWPKLAIILWGLMWLGTSRFPLTNAVTLDTFLRSHYLYFLTFAFHQTPRIYEVAPEPPRREADQIEVAQGEKQDILVITSEALRGDLFQGMESSWMPEISRLAKGGTFFSNHYSISPVTLNSFYTILTGRYSSKTPQGEEAYSFFEVAKRAGYRTEAFQPFEKFDKFPGVEGQIDKIHKLDLTQKKLILFHSSSGEITRRAKEMLSDLDRREGPYILWIHYTDPHAVYNDPDDPLGSRLALTEERAKAKYLKEVRAVDMAVGELVDYIRTSLRKQPKILFTADHGQEFLEHWNRTHGTYLYEESLRVPFLILDPEVREGRVVESVTAHTDILPTLLEWMEVKIKDYPLPGFSLAPATRGKPLPEHDSLFLVSDKRHFVGILEGEKKLIYYFFHLKFPAIELFDLKRDPAERTNLAESQPAETDRLRSKLLAWMNSP